MMSAATGSTTTPVACKAHWRAAAARLDEIGQGSGGTSRNRQVKCRQKRTCQYFIQTNSRAIPAAAGPQY